ncbi:hypothetical protein F5B19DRAFT_257174 [Rostrohypoxylon terebratum]|nr:hypothetical protein F5B19DRAFT_257174 [Rostrohypoxylon terebratum]
MASAALLHSKLDTLYDVWQSLTPASSPAEITEFASFFSENCTAYLLSMRELSAPSIGRAGVIEGIKDVIKDSQIKERRVLDRFSSTSSPKISVEMNNRLTVRGREIDAFPETATVVFDDKGLITDFKLYCCRSAVVEIIQDVTGVGPYRRDDKCH